MFARLVCDIMSENGFTWHKLVNFGASNEWIAISSKHKVDLANRIAVKCAKMLLSLVLWLLFPVFSIRSLVLTHAYIVTRSQTFLLFQLEQIGSLAAQD